MKQVLPLIALLTGLIPATAKAAEATDTVRFATHNVVLEDDPKRGQYNFSLYSDDGQWKVQLNYHAEGSMFGTFGNDDFGLSTTGKYYNYARNPKNDMVFYSFTDMAVEVSDRSTEYHISANCLASNNVRFLIEGSLDVLTPMDTVSLDLGYAQRVTNTFYGTHTFTAETDAYQLTYGVVAPDPVGTFYTADILMPELTDKRTGQRVGLKSATAVHRLEADTLWLTLDALADDLRLYHLTMYNAERTVPVVAEETIDIEGDITLQDLTEMYGCYQLSGQNRTWAVGIAFVPDAFAPGRREWTMDDIFMPYTTLIRLEDQHAVRIHDVHVWLTDADQLTFRADITATDGVLYHITLRTAGPGYLGEPDAVVEMDLGQAAMLDYTEPGVIGLGAYLPMQYQLRLYLNAHRLEGDYYTDDAVLDRCDVMVVRPQTSTFVFHDARRVNTHFETDREGQCHVTVDMLGVDNVLYHATFTVPALRCLADASYVLDDALMVALRDDADASAPGQQPRYTLQFQRLPDDADQLDAIRDGEIFTFGFTPAAEGIGGDYGYSAGNLDPAATHVVYEQGTELRLGPVAGTLSLKPVQRVTFDGTYHTTLYDTEFRFVAQNSVIYEGRGRTLLLCIDAEGELVEVSEPALASIRQQLAERGLRVQKVLRGGRMMIVSPTNNNEENRYTADGKRID